MSDNETYNQYDTYLMVVVDTYLMNKWHRITPMYDAESGARLTILPSVVQ